MELFEIAWSRYAARCWTPHAWRPGRRGEVDADDLVAFRRSLGAAGFQQ